MSVNFNYNTDFFWKIIIDMVNVEKKKHLILQSIWNIICMMKDSKCQEWWDDEKKMWSSKNSISICWSLQQSFHLAHTWRGYFYFSFVILFVIYPKRKATLYRNIRTLKMFLHKYFFISDFYDNYDLKCWMWILQAVFIYQQPHFYIFNTYFGSFSTNAIEIHKS